MTSVSTRSHLGGAVDDRERSRNAARPVGVVEPLVLRMRIASAAAGTNGDGGNAARDRDVRVGRRRREIGLAAEQPCRRQRVTHEWMRNIGLTARARADRLDRERQGARADGAAVILLLACRARGDLDLPLMAVG